MQRDMNSKDTQLKNGESCQRCGVNPALSEDSAVRMTDFSNEKSGFKREGKYGTEKIF